MKKETTFLKTSPKVNCVYTNPVLSKMPFPLYFDSLPKKTSFDNKNSEESENSSSTSSKKEEVKSTPSCSKNEISIQSSVCKKKGFLKNWEFS